MLGYPFGAVENAGLWEGFRGFERLPDMLRKAQSAKRRAEGARSKAVDGDGWMHGGLEGEDGVAVRPGYGECSEWVVPLANCEAGKVY